MTTVTIRVGGRAEKGEHETLIRALKEHLGANVVPPAALKGRDPERGDFTFYAVVPTSQIARFRSVIRSETAGWTVGSVLDTLWDTDTGTDVGASSADVNARIQANVRLAADAARKETRPVTSQCL